MPTYCEQSVVFVAVFDSVEGMQHVDSKRLPKSPGAAEQLNFRSARNQRGKLRLVQVGHSGFLANAAKARISEWKLLQLAAQNEPRARSVDEESSRCNLFCTKVPGIGGCAEKSGRSTEWGA